MQRNWLAGWAAACLAAGCAGPTATSPSGVKLAANGRPESFGRPQVEQVSWTERIVAPFRDDPASKLQQDAVAKAQAAQRLEINPIALGDDGGPPSAQLYVAMAAMSCRSGNVAQGRALYQKAIALEPQNVDALLGAARMEDREGRMDVAMMFYHRAAAADSNNPTVFNDLGLCLARQGRLADAERALTRAVQLEPAKPLYRNNIAKVQIEMNRMDAAVGHLAAVYPPPVVNYNMGVLLYDRGRAAEAEQFLTTALAMDPRMDPARELLATMHPEVSEYRMARAPEPAGSASSELEARPSFTTPQVIETGAAEMPESDNAPALLPPVT